MLKCPFSIKKTEKNLHNINITEEMVRNEILKLNVDKSSEPDEVHPQILIEIVDLVSKPLALFLNKTMDAQKDVPVSLENGSVNALIP